jgi:hypothetical protein
MWPFKKKNQKVKFVDPQTILFTQFDITERFDDHLRLRNDEWIETVPLKRDTGDPESQGLPPTDASDDEIYRLAESVSKIREAFNIPNDGVYCPVCHIANVMGERLSNPCPECDRPLLKFGWD